MSLWKASRLPEGEKLGAESSPEVRRSWLPVEGSSAQMPRSAGSTMRPVVGSRLADEYAITPFPPGNDPSASAGRSATVTTITRDDANLVTIYGDARP